MAAATKSTQTLTEMKTETVRQFMLKKYPTKDYFDCPVPQHHWPAIQEYAETYARLMIELDRVRVKEHIEIIQCDTEYNSVTGRRDPIYCVDEQSIDQTPIILT